VTKGLATVLLSFGLAWNVSAQVEGDKQPTPLAGPQAPGVNDRSVSWREMIPNLADDQKRIWTFPAHLTHDHNWIPTLAVAAATAGLIVADSKTEKPFATTTAFHGFNSVFNSTATSAVTAAVPVTLYAVGLWKKDSYAAHTALLAGEAVADSEIIATAFKTATRRERPEYFPTTGNFADSWYEGPGGVGLGHGGFPSGHAIAAFSVATVMSRRYGKTHKWVPYLAYGVAATIGFSRVTTLAHFPSDVFLGAALGYSVSRFAVLR
jgi:membrane-associated phospholipid phosphatase